MLSGQGKSVAIILLVGFILIAILLGGYYFYERESAPPSPGPSPGSPSNHKPSPKLPTPDPSGDPVKLTDAHIALFTGGLPMPIYWAAPSTSSTGTVYISSSPNDFNLDPKTGMICRTENTDMCMGINTSGTPSSGDKLEQANTKGMSKARLRNFVWNMWNLGGDDDSHQITGMCQAENEALCLQLGGTSDGPYVKLGNNAGGDWDNFAWDVHGSTS